MSGLKHLGVLENKELLKEKKKDGVSQKGIGTDFKEFSMANENLSYTKKTVGLIITQRITYISLSPYGYK